MIATATSATEIVLPGKVEPDGLQVRTRTLPTPAAGHALVRMEATGVSFAEQQMRLGKYYDQPPFPFVPGYDVVGTVVAVGPGVDLAMVGGRYAAVTKVGGWASLLQVEAADLVPVPDSLDPAEAETLRRQRHHRLADAAPQGDGPPRAARSWCWAPTAASAPPSCSWPGTPASR